MASIYWPTISPMNMNMNNITNATLDQLLYNIPKTNTSMLYTLPAFDTIFKDVPPDMITRSSGQASDLLEIDVEEIPYFITDTGEEEYLVVPHCHVIGMLPFTSDSKFSTGVSPISVEHASAIALAVQHLNTGNSSIVSTLGELRESTCSEMTFTVEFVDTKDNPGDALDHVFNVTDRRVRDYGYKTPCAFIGAVRSAVTLPVALLTGHKGYLEVSGQSTSFQLEDRVQYPHFARTVPPDSENVIPIMDYFINELELKYVVLIHMNEAYGNSFAESLQVESDKRGQNRPRIRRISIDSTGDSTDAALEELRSSQYRYVLAVMPNMKFYDKLLETAFKKGLAGNGEYQWYFSESFTDLRNYGGSEALQKAYNGTGMFRPSAGRLHNNTNFNDFVSLLHDISMSKEDREYVNGLIPRDQNAQKLYDYLHKDEDKDEENTNDDNNKHEYGASAFMYDATIAMGISACQASGLGNELGFTANEQFHLLTQQTRFHGVTGDIVFNNKTGSRTYNSTFYELINFVNEELLDEKTGKKWIHYKRHTTDTYCGGEWLPGEREFIFNNEGVGITEKPQQLPPTKGDNNLIPMYMKAMALFFSALSIATAIGFGIWTWFKRSTRVIMASQPFFLYLIVFGVIMVASSIIPFSMDDSKYSLVTSSKACTAVVWLLFPGLSIIFSALFTKTYRINLVMKNSKKFRRVKVTIRETLITMVVMLILNIITLSLMTVRNPPKYERKILFEDKFDRASETYGTCTWDGQEVYLAILIAINLLIALLSAYQSWRARELSTEFQESQYIFTALVITLTLFMVALPVIIMSRSTPKTTVFIYSAAALIFCMNILLLIFVPKMRFHYNNRKDNNKIKNTFIGGVATAGNTPGVATSVPHQDVPRISSYVGEKILTTQSARVLAEQVAELQQLLREKEEHCNCNRMDADPETIAP